MDLSGSQHSGSITTYVGGSSHIYPYMPEIGDSSVKKSPKKPRGSARSSYAENHRRGGPALSASGPPGSSPYESKFPSVRKTATADNTPRGDEILGEKAERHQWISPFCREPEDDLQTCCLGCWLPCCLYGKTQHRLLQISDGLDPLDETTYKKYDKACWGFACVELLFGPSCVFAALDRTRIRTVYDIQGTVTSDVLTTLCCSRCALMQHDREIRAREKLATTNGEKLNRSRTICEQPSRHPDLGYTAPLFSDPSSAKKMPHRSNLVREKQAEANIGLKTRKAETEKEEQSKSQSKVNKLRKYPKLCPGGKGYNKGRDSTGPKNPESSMLGVKSTKNPSPLGSALNPIARPTKIDPSERNAIISSRQPWRGHGMTIKPKSKPKQNSDQEMNRLAPRSLQHPVVGFAREDTGSNDSMDHTPGRRVVFKGSEEDSTTLNNGSRLPNKPALISPSHRRSSMAGPNAYVSSPAKDYTEDESVLVYYSDGEVPQRHRVRDCARLRASTIGRPEAHRENRVLSDCASDSAASITEEPSTIEQPDIAELPGSTERQGSAEPPRTVQHNSSTGLDKTMDTNPGEAREHRDESNGEGGCLSQDNKEVNVVPSDDKRPHAISQHSLNECVVEHVETVTEPRPVRNVPQHYLADCVQAEFEPEIAKVVNASQHSIADYATTEDTRIPNRDHAIVSSNSSKEEKRRGGALGAEQCGPGTESTDLDGPEAVGEDALQQDNVSFRPKSLEEITSIAPIGPNGTERTRLEGYRRATAGSQIERKHSETPSEAATALRRVLRKPIEREPSLSNVLDGTTDMQEQVPIRMNRIRGGRGEGERTAPY